MVVGIKLNGLCRQVIAGCAGEDSMHFIDTLEVKFVHRLLSTYEQIKKYHYFK